MILNDKCMNKKMLKFVNIGQQNPPKREVTNRKDDFNEIYNEFIELYDYHINNVNKNLEDDLEIKTFNIDEDGILVG